MRTLFVRILAVSDLRVHRIELLEHVATRVRPDLILYGGDDVERFDEGPNSWAPLARMTRYGLCGVVGNDCRRATALEQPGCRNLQRGPLLFDDLAILGLQGAPADEGQALGSTVYTRREARTHLASQCAKAGARSIILVSHCPPRGVLDQALRYRAESIGSTEVRRFAQRPNVKAIICGHAHACGGASEDFGSCLVVNVASHDHPGSPLRYAVLELEGKTLRVSHGNEKDRKGFYGLQGFGPHRIARLHRLGLHSLRDLLNADQSVLREAFTTPQIARRVRAKARAIHTNSPVVIAAPPALPPCAVLVDTQTSMEGIDPWLIHLEGLESERRRRFQELDPRKHLTHLLRFEKSAGGKYSHFVQWGHFTRSSLARAWFAHRANAGEQPAILNGTRWISAMKYVTNAIALPILDHKLNTVASFFGFEFADFEMNGTLAGSWYARHCQSQQPFDIQRVVRYSLARLSAMRHVIRATCAAVAHCEYEAEPTVRFVRRR